MWTAKSRFSDNTSIKWSKPCYTAIPKITISQTCYDLF